MKKAVILIACGDSETANAIVAAFEPEGCSVFAAETLEKGISAAEELCPDLIIPDAKMTDGNGMSSCEKIRGKSGARTLFLCAQNERSDALAGLLAGGDDCIFKPYDTEELVLRADALLRKGKLSAQKELSLWLGKLELDFVAGRALFRGRDILLKPKEFALLAVLAREIGKTFSANELYRKVWGMDMAGDCHTVKEHISRIRGKLGKEFEYRIESRRGRGYCLKACGENE